MKVLNHKSGVIKSEVNIPSFTPKSGPLNLSDFDGDENMFKIYKEGLEYINHITNQIAEDEKK